MSSSVRAPRVPSAGVEHPEGLGEPALGSPPACALSAEPAAQHALEVVHVRGLRDVRAQRGELAVEGVGDVDLAVVARPPGRP